MVAGIASVILVIAVSACGVPFQPNPAPSTVTPDPSPTARYYSNQVDMVTVTASHAPGQGGKIDRSEQCPYWAIVEAGALAWQGMGRCDSNTLIAPPETGARKMTAPETAAFWTMLDQVNISSWREWVYDQEGGEALPAGTPIYIVEVSVSGDCCLYFDDIWVGPYQPQGWQTFFDAVQQAVEGGPVLA